MANNDLFDKYHQLSLSVKKNLYLLDPSGVDSDPQKLLVGFNDKVIISENMAFLEAIKKDVGGDIIDDDVLGRFLYIDSESLR
jgi:hypothetical protein